MTIAGKLWPCIICNSRANLVSQAYHNDFIPSSMSSRSKVARIIVRSIEFTNLVFYNMSCKQDEKMRSIRVKILTKQQ